MTGLTYFKRFRMEMDLRGSLPPLPELPEGYFALPWDDGLLGRHAEVKYHSFREELDGDVFPNLCNIEGCVKLMETIRHRSGFLPGATWLLAYGIDYCGTIQGVRDSYGLGAIQNIGVTPEHRHKGLGKQLLLRALHGFKAAGVFRAILEVTARNSSALQLYRRVGFQCKQTVYKPIAVDPVQVAEPMLVR
jgi:ribosomal protein S18 acetylase RimI-like enzyme